MIARTRKTRCKQIEAWLNAEYPPAYPVTVKWVQHIPYGRTEEATAAERRIGDSGDCWIGNQQIEIRLSLRALPTIVEAGETLRHEWAHALDVMGGALEKHRLDDHQDEYWLKFGRIFRAWGAIGWKDSGEY